MQAMSNLSDFRSNILAGALAHFREPARSDEVVKFEKFNVFPNTVTCPPGRELVVIGWGEGMKYACDIKGLAAPCLVYSLGSNVSGNVGTEVLGKDCENQSGRTYTL